MKRILTFSILLISSVCFSQNFKIFNSNTTKKISSTNFLELGVYINKGNNQCCNFIHHEGFLTGTSKDSLSFNFHSSAFRQELNSSDLNLNSPYLNNASNKTIAKKDILYLTDYKSEKNRKSRKNLSMIGGLVMIGGLATAINALIFADNNKNDLLIAGGIQFSTGLIIGLSSHKKRTKFTDLHDPWEID